MENYGISLKKEHRLSIISKVMLTIEIIASSILLIVGIMAESWIYFTSSIVLVLLSLFYYFFIGVIREISITLKEILEKNQSNNQMEVKDEIPQNNTLHEIKEIDSENLCQWK